MSKNHLQSREQQLAQYRQDNEPLNMTTSQRKKDLVKKLNRMNSLMSLLDLEPDNTKVKEEAETVMTDIYSKLNVFKYISINEKVFS